MLLKMKLNREVDVGGLVVGGGDGWRGALAAVVWWCWCWLTSEEEGEVEREWERVRGGGERW